MSYKEEFASNNTDLQTILDVVNGLPDKAKTCKVYVKTLASSGYYPNYATATIGDTTYVANKESSPDTIVEVEIGTEITLLVKGTAAISDYANIIINGEKVVSSAGMAGVTYPYTVTQDTTVELSVNPTGEPYPYGVINVVTGEIEGDADISLVPESESTFTPTDSGGTTYKSKFADNNVDLQAILDKVNSL